MKAVCNALGVARSNVHLQAMRKSDCVNGRTAPTRDPNADLVLIDAARTEITCLPTYRYRRADALVNRTRSLISMLPVNHKRCYRLMEEYGLLLPKAPKRRASSRPHDGKVAVTDSHTRWCSDGFEITCENGQVVTSTFTKDCCDREIISWRAWSRRSLPGEPVREMLIEAVEARFENSKPVQVRFNS